MPTASASYHSLRLSLSPSFSLPHLIFLSFPLSLPFSASLTHTHSLFSITHAPLLHNSNSAFIPLSSTSLVSRLPSPQPPSPSRSLAFCFLDLFLLSSHFHSHSQCFRCLFVRHTGRTLHKPVYGVTDRGSCPSVSSKCRVFLCSTVETGKLLKLSVERLIV